MSVTVALGTGAPAPSTINTAPQALPLRFRSAKIVAQSLVLPTQFLDLLLRIGRRRGLIALRHATLMPDPRAQYKAKTLCLCVSVACDRCEARVSAMLTR